MTDQLVIRLEGSTLAAMKSSHAPDRGDFVTIHRVTYAVSSRTYTVDDGYDESQHGVICVIDLENARG